ncbi:glycosyltransferase family 2 protein [candidate division WWE3 bacterium]|uniref:dolichyl-phosphate beta-glucosyltransferase n=1 Tax=candidate division WWE3 bacterium TaxID=2053526 RepID=A0A7X9E6L0_UNCKA|nr:glycosyltransferase family 2 protein [candidate division WWE3 bacterium]
MEGQEMIEYSIVIPAYNEEDKVTSSLTQVVNFMRSFCSSFEVLVVNDGSRDTTADKVGEYVRENPEVKLINNPHRGKGYAVWTGMQEAKGKLVYMADMDLSAPIEELRKLSIWIKDQDFDIVIASREGVGARRIGEPFYRHLMGRVFNVLVQLIALPGITDSQCGFKLFKGDVAKDIFGRLDIYGKKAVDIDKAYLGAWDVEVLYLARKLGYTIKQVPVTWTFVKTKRLSPVKDSLKMALDVLKIRINDLKGKYKSAQMPRK